MDVPVRFASETAASVFADQDHIIGSHAHPSGNGAYCLRCTLRAGVKEQLPVLPIGHGAASLHALVTRVRRDKRFIKNEVRTPEACIQIAIGPLVCRLAHRHLALCIVLKIPFCPLDFHHVQRRRSRGASRSCTGHRSSRRLAHPRIPVGARVRSARPQAHKRIHNEGQLLIRHLDFLDGFRRRKLIYGGQRENRFALIYGLQRESAFAARVSLDHRSEVGDGVRRSRQVVHRDHAPHAGHRESFPGIDVDHSCMWVRAEQQLREEHAVRAVILSVFRSARHLGHQVRRRVVLSNQFRLVRWGIRCYERFVWRFRLVG